MVDNFAIVLTHSLMALACWRMLSRPGLDDENGGADRRRLGGRGDAPDA